MAQISTKLDSGLTTFTFEDMDGHVFSSFRINPADMGLITRSEEFQEYFSELGKGDFGDDARAIAQKEQEIGEKMNYLLGYKSYDDVFGEVGPLTLLPDGKFFVEHVMERFTDSIAPIIAERQKKMEKNIDKYTRKYEKKK